ncbi:MAG: hypothetical protein JWP97_216 [Labilithrix sp.]|nr:hypothetical protein [Labilithrix sp.]
MVERDDDPGAPGARDEDPDAPASAEEALASGRLRDALAGRIDEGELDPATAADVAFALALQAAWDPGTLSVDESQALVDALPSAEEQRLAAVLRDALEAPAPRAPAGDQSIDLALSLRAAYAPAGLGDAEHRQIVRAALAALPARRNNVVRVAFGALALAAGVFFVVTQAPIRGDREAPLALARTRTTQPLFNEPFKPGETSARIDRIASARASDFRDNRFATWGVR